MTATPLTHQIGQAPNLPWGPNDSAFGTAPSNYSGGCGWNPVCHVAGTADGVWDSGWSTVVGAKDLGVAIATDPWGTAKTTASGAYDYARDCATGRYHGKLDACVADTYGSGVIADARQNGIGHAIGTVVPDALAVLTGTGVAAKASTRLTTIARRFRGQWAINTVDDLVDLASPARRTHILDGDATGGGHLWPGNPDKSPFPQGWSGDKIMHEISDIATDPVAWQNAVPQGSRTVLAGTRDGVDIRVIVDTSTGEIITGYPTNLPRNP
jgi:hypothetical protein